jgi:hypothetical protein
MVTRYRIGVDGTQMDSLDKSICIQDIRYGEIEISKQIETPGNRDGGIVTKTYRQKATVEVEFTINQYTPYNRRKVMDKVKTWAKTGGRLITFDRPEQALYHAEVDKFPEITSSMRWTDPLTVVFADYHFPYWQDIEPIMASITGTNPSGKIKIAGNAPKAFVGVDVMPLGGAIKWFEVTCASTTIRVEASVAKNATVTIDYDDFGNLRIMNGKTSLLANRTGSSSDMLIAKPGASNTIKVKASGSTKINAVFYGRGAWL